MATITVRLTGTTPMLQHNARLSDKLDPAAKALAAVTSKRKKTDDDQEEIARVEFDGGMYFSEASGPYVPGTWIDACLAEAAKASKLGKAFKSAVRCGTDECALQYDGPRDVDGLWAKGFYDRRSVRNQQNRVMRTRPRFPVGWTCVAEIHYDESVVNVEDLEAALTRAGTLVGIGDYRPRFGRFSWSVVA